MSFFQRLFNKTTSTEYLVECPRCLGKGHVDLDDIKRLKNELKWIPGKCAYCNGVSKVKPEMITEVAANDAYLTINISKLERTLFINGNQAAIKRGEAHKEYVDLIIQNIKELYFVENLDIEEIAELYLQSIPEWDIKQKNELSSYIKKVIEHSSKSK
ncbi:hypothetical protein SAMN05518672_108190 [Chitinophaga sp. CF118]|uniref:hypothetical protein n=1 Tax=Chitinophaga sp. CF118 TaxID=1884367 RepID=UPI0008F2D551|nr:hypothetical protein [Chitinophaga sp. CF118]SFE63632.1 hypothetical protein SAMN05518672_108190 [Chitinophaga sp. CF118]